MELLIDDNLSTREKIFALEAMMKEHPEQLDLPVIHHFSFGVYGRELHIPAGVVLIGEIHKFENLNILSKGEMTLVTDDGIKRVEAPFTVVSPPGTKRAAIAHTDCVWTTIHGTDLKDLAEIEKMFIAKSEEEYIYWKVKELI